MSKITVLYPIKVPPGKYCWEYTFPHELCEHFDNEGGHETCNLGFYIKKSDDGGVVKPKECFNLKVKDKSGITVLD